MQISFQPLSRNRYRVLGAPRPMVVKKAQIGRTRRVLWEAARRRRRSAQPRPATAVRLPVVDPNHPVDYFSQSVPPSYRCGTCGATDCKLWRDYQTFLDFQELSCAPCAAASQKKDISDMDEDGRYTSEITGSRCDQIGWRVPAVPTAANDTFWGYTSVPEEAVEWWRKLPTFPPAA